MTGWTHGRCGPNCFYPDCDCKPEWFGSPPTLNTGSVMPMIEMSDSEIFSLQAAVEHLRSVAPDEADMEGRARRADAAFRIAYNLEQIAKRAFAAPAKPEN